jgi:nucleoside phosphorylase
MAEIFNEYANEISSHPRDRQKTFDYDRHPTLRHHEYSIAWICALPIELAAARAILDETHGSMPTFVDSNTYVLGSIIEHIIVIACLPLGYYGTINAANIMMNMRRTFPAIRTRLMVGVGGGVTSKGDVRLGDVVVGTGVMQYDIGKLLGHGQLRRTATLGFLTSCLERPCLPSVRNMNCDPVDPVHLTAKLEGHSGYRRPSLPDRLFYATYEHESPSTSSDTDQSKFVQRSRRMSNDIVIHYGAIASGHQVVRSGIIRDRVTREVDVMCFEMEAAGVMDILHCLPIQGICDYWIHTRTKTGRGMQRQLWQHTRESCLRKYL